MGPLRNIYYGATAWAEPSLVRAGSFYPPWVRTPEERLRYYASHFPLVEVDSTHYAPPSEENARRWAERTPAGFVFDVKAYGLLTFHRVGPNTLPPPLRPLVDPKARAKGYLYPRALPPEGIEELWELHRQALVPLVEAGKLGVVLFQFPFWFTNNRHNRAYLESLPERLPYPIAVEFRGGGWMDEPRRDETLSLLGELGLTYVIVDEPQGTRASTPPVVATTSALAVIRLHGRNAARWLRRVPTAAERFDYVYSEPELAHWADAAVELSRRAEGVHVLFNNCYRDNAVRNASRLGELLEQRLGPQAGLPG